MFGIQHTSAMMDPNGTTQKKKQSKNPTAQTEQTISYK